MNVKKKSRLEEGGNLPSDPLVYATARPKHLSRLGGGPSLAQRVDVATRVSENRDLCQTDGGGRRTGRKFRTPRHTSQSAKPNDFQCHDHIIPYHIIRLIRLSVVHNDATGARITGRPYRIVCARIVNADRSSTALSRGNVVNKHAGAVRTRRINGPSDRSARPCYPSATFRAREFDFIMFCCFIFEHYNTYAQCPICSSTNDGSRRARFSRWRIITITIQVRDIVCAIGIREDARRARQ